MKCQEESWALKVESKGKVAGSLAAARFYVGGAHATLRAARRLLYLQYAATRGRQASWERIEMGGE